MNKYYPLVMPPEPFEEEVYIYRIFSARGDDVWILRLKVAGFTYREISEILEIPFIRIRRRIKRMKGKEWVKRYIKNLYSKV